RPVDGRGDVAEEVGEAAGVILVRVGEDDALDPVGVLAQVGEVRQDEVDAGHVRVGEHEPAIDDEDPILDFEAEEDATDLAQPPAKDEPYFPVHRADASDRRRCVSRPTYWWSRYASGRLRTRGFAVLRDLVERRVLLAGVGPVLELDDAELGEPLAQPAVAGVEQPDLLPVPDDLREQQRLEHLALRRLHDDLDDLLDVDVEAVPDLLLEEPVAHAHGGLECELLTLPDLGTGQLLVVLLQRDHAEGNMARLVAHHVPEELLEQRLSRHLLDEPEGGEGETLDHDLHAEVGHVPPRVLDD